MRRLRPETGQIRIYVESEPLTYSPGRLADPWPRLRWWDRNRIDDLSSQPLKVGDRLVKLSQNPRMHRVR